MTNETQWTSEDIQDAVKEAAHNYDIDMNTLSITIFRAEQLMRRVRNDLAARIDTLTAALAAERDASRIVDANLTGDVALAEGENRRLRAELEAGQGAWEPLPDGYNTGRIDMFEIQIGLDSGSLYIFNINQNRKCWRVPLHDNMKLCYRRIAPATAGDGGDV